MTKKLKVDCPVCRERIKEPLETGRTVICDSCCARFDVLADPSTGRAVLLDIAPPKASEPLYLPKGSVRASVTLLISMGCWLLILRGIAVPDYIFNLILGILGYYFAYRKASKAFGSYLYKKGEHEEEPLFLPHGFIRFFLISGFVVVSMWLVLRGHPFDDRFVRFLALLWGLVIGYAFTKVADRKSGGAFHNGIGHLKALVVLAASLILLFLLFTGAHLPSNSSGDHTCLLLAAVISFYFGSKT